MKLFNYICNINYISNTSLNFVSDKFERNNMDYLHVHNSYAAIRFTIPKSKKIFIEKTSIAKR